MVRGKMTHDTLSLSMGTAEKGEPDCRIHRVLITTAQQGGNDVEKFPGFPSKRVLLSNNVPEAKDRGSRTCVPIFRDGKEIFAAFCVSILLNTKPNPKKSNFAAALLDGREEARLTHVAILEF